MKKEIILFLIMWPSLFAIAGQNSLAVGINGSKFADTKSELRIGFSIDFAHEWTLSRNVGICAGLRYMTRGAGLKNKVIFPYGSFIFTKDIDCRFGYVELPIGFRVYTPIFERKVYFQFGVTPALSISDGSTSKTLSEQNKWDLPDEFDPADADYYPNEYGTFGKFHNSVTKPEIAIGIKLHSYAVQARVSYDYWGETDVADGIASMNHKFLTTGLQLFWNF